MIMSKVLEKTFDSINSIFNNTGFLNPVQDKIFHINPNIFCNRFRNVRNKKEEEEIVTSCIQLMEKRLSHPDISNAEIENMVKLCMVCERLGYPCPFIYIHAIKLAQKGNLQEKQTGYLASIYFLNPRHEFVILLINTMQKDLCSVNYVENVLALKCICNLINNETVHNVLHLIEDRLIHKNSEVRKLAVLALDHCLQLTDTQSAYQMALSKLEKVLTDSCIEVVAIAVRTIYKIILKLPGDFSYLIDSLIQIQEQILQRRLPPDMYYAEIPAPWLQIDLIKLLSHLCTSHELLKHTIPLFKKTLLQAEVNHQMAYAIKYQIIEALANSELDEDTIQLILSSISTFLKSKTANYKYMGIQALISFVKKIKPTIAQAQQDIIIECLKQPDETLQLKTLELLYQLATPSNVHAVAKKMTEFLSLWKDVDQKKDIALKILHLAEKFNLNQKWYATTVKNVLLEADELISNNDICNIVNIILSDDVMKETVKNEYLNMCHKEKITPSLVKLIASILSHPNEFQEFLPLLMQHSDENATLWLFLSLQEVILKTKVFPEELVQFLRDLSIENENCKEVLDQLLNLFDNINAIKDYNSSEQLDASLTFLDDYVIKSLESGLPCYRPQSLRLSSFLIEQSTTSLIFSESSSDISLAENSTTSSLPKSPLYNPINSPSVSAQSLAFENENLIQFAKSKHVWTKEGRKISEKNVDVSHSENDNEISQNENRDQDLMEIFAGLS